MLSTLSALLLTLGPAPTPALGVQILQPTDRARVSGTVQISGTATDLGTGRVSVSIDGGPFLLAQGGTSWSFSWDASSVSDGAHTITARARESFGGPAVFDSIGVVVANSTGGLSVQITSPADGATVLDTLTVEGTSDGATAVEIAVDAGAFQPTNGVDPWNAIFEPGSLAPGGHVLTARATDGAGEAFDSISIVVGDPPPGAQQISYASSVDGEALGAELWIPQGFDPQGPPVPLVLHLHGGGGTGNLNGDFRAALDARGWIGLAPDGRLWDIHTPGDPQSCTWVHSAAYVDNPDPEVGPGETDILDAIDWAVANYPIDLDRIYLTGFSMGGRGTYIIGLKHPDRFAAIAPMGSASDMYEIFVRRPEPSACKEGMVGGQPGDSPFVDTMYTITSGRFLLENAYNVPVFAAHGLNDTTANNDPSVAPFLHGWHMATDGSFSECHADPDFCFGHTPTLAELDARHPGQVDWAYMFTPVGHMTDPLWLEGTPITEGLFGTEDPLDPGNLLGIFEFFERRTLIHSPDSLLYKSYTSTHRKAYWATIDISTPWLDTPGAIRATRDTSGNSLDLELVRVEHAAIDLELAGLALAPGQPLAVELSELFDTAYDPALAPGPESLVTTLELTGDFDASRGVRVFRDGTPLASSLASFAADRITIGPLTVDAPTSLRIVALPAAYLQPKPGARGRDAAPTPAPFPGG